MDLDRFPVEDSLRTITGPTIAPYPPVPGEDYESWWAITTSGEEIAVPVAVIQEMEQITGGRAYSFKPNDPDDPNPWERIRGDLNTAAERVRERGA